MKYYIDFISWVVEANSGEEAYEKARCLLKKGVVPQINLDEGIEEVLEEIDNFGEDIIDQEDL